MSETHYRVGAGKCACGFDAYKIDGIMLDYGDLLASHIRRAKRLSEAATLAAARSDGATPVVDAYEFNGDSPGLGGQELMDLYRTGLDLAPEYGERDQAKREKRSHEHALCYLAFKIEMSIRKALAAQAVQVPEIPGGWILAGVFRTPDGESPNDQYEAIIRTPDQERVIYGGGAKWEEALRAAIEQAKGGGE